MGLDPTLERNCALSLRKKHEKRLFFLKNKFQPLFFKMKKLGGGVLYVSTGLIILQEARRY